MLRITCACGNSIYESEKYCVYCGRRVPPQTKLNIKYKVK